MVRMAMRLAEAELLGDRLLSTSEYEEAVRIRLLDQLWLRAVLVEQRRRTNTSERDAFDARADRVLAAIDVEEATRVAA